MAGERSQVTGAVGWYPDQKGGAAPASQGDDVSTKFLAVQTDNNSTATYEDVARRNGLPLDDPYVDKSKAAPKAGIDYGVNDGPPPPVDATAPASNPQEQPAKVRPLGDSTLYPALRDVARGATEIPRAMIKGTRDAAQETLNTMAALGNWVDRHTSAGVALTEGPVGEDLPPSTEDARAGAAANPALKAPQLPDINAPTTVTGGVAKSISQFLVAFSAAGNLPGMGKLAALAETGAAGEVTQAAVKGAVAEFAAFDPYEQRLSNLLKDHTDIAKPVTEFLAANPNDDEVVARTKRALEGAGLGVVTEGLIHALKVLRAARAARAAVAAGEAAAGAGERAVALATMEQKAAAPLEALGDPNDPALIVAKKNSKLAAAEAATEGMDPMEVLDKYKDLPDELHINFARIDTSEDIKRVIQQMAEKDVSAIKEGQRGVRTWDQTKASAARKDAWKLLEERAPKGVLNAEETLAARQLWTASGEKLAELAREAAVNPTDTSVFAFRKMLATHYAIQREVMAIRTETARALNAWKIPAGATKARADALNAMVENFGGKDVGQALAQKVAEMDAAGLVASIDKLAEGGWAAKTRDALYQAYYASLLCNPTTFMAKTMSELATVVQTVGERAAGAKLSQLLGTTNGVAVGEASEMVFGMLEGFKDGLRGLFSTGNVLSDDVAAVFKNSSKMGAEHVSAISPEAWNVARNTLPGQALNLLDVASQAPGRLLEAGTEVFQMVGYRMEMRAQALRQAAEEVRSGVLPAADLRSRIAAIVDNPSDDLKALAYQQALTNTFQKKPAEALNNLGIAFQNLPLGRFLAPFRRTPINLLTAMAERTPLAPLVKSWRADLMAGGARADLAIARVSTGSFMMLGAMDLALTGHITGGGPKDPNQLALLKRQGWQPYSVKVGNKWVSYARAEPIGGTIGLAADIAEVAMNASEQHTKAIEDLVIGSTFAVAKHVMSRSYLKGMADLVQAIQDPDRSAEKMAQHVAGTLVPAGVAQYARQVDPDMRVVHSMLESVQSRIPYYSKDLPAARDLWGREIQFKSPFGKAFSLLSPVYVSEESAEPIDKELSRLGYAPSPPATTIDVKGVKIDLKDYPQIYSRYIQLAGNESKDPAWHLGAKDFLNRIVERQHPLSAMYWRERPGADGPDGHRANFIRSKIQSYRERAQTQLRKEFPVLEAIYQTKKPQHGAAVPR